MLIVYLLRTDDGEELPLRGTRLGIWGGRGEGAKLDPRAPKLEVSMFNG